MRTKFVWMYRQWVFALINETSLNLTIKKKKKKKKERERERERERELVRRCRVQPMIEEDYRILNVGLLLSTLYIFSIFGAQIDCVCGQIMRQVDSMSKPNTFAHTINL